MYLTRQTAKQIREVFLGGNPTSSNLKDNLDGVTWQQAITKINYFNSIAALVYHINYFVSAMIHVLHGQPLNASDKYSFDVPPINCKEDWEKLLHKTWAEAESFAVLVEALPEHILQETFADEKYGTYYKNIHGVIEHTHYHLGQIEVIKKLLSSSL